MFPSNDFAFLSFMHGHGCRIVFISCSPVSGVVNLFPFIFADVLTVPELNFNISLLTDHQPMEYQTGDELEKKLRPGIDGVILRDPSMGAATFLPQVWEQLPTVPQFLNHLCGKAGMPEDTWQKRHILSKEKRFVYF